MTLKETRTRTRKPTATSVAADALGITEADVGSVTQPLGRLDAQAIGAALAEIVRVEPERLLGGADGHSRPGRTLVTGPDADLLALDSALVLAPAGVVTHDELVLRMYDDLSGRGIDALAPWTATTHLLPAFQGWVEHVLGPGSPWRHGQFQVVATRTGVALERWHPGRASRADLVVPDEVWKVVDRHVHGALELAEVFAAEGLAASSGLLCVGPPGTGKSQLARTIAAELRGRATVLVPEARSARYLVREVLDLARRLAPTLVVLDDLDLVVGHRRGGDPTTVREFLTSMDETMARAEGVVVLGSTNDPSSIDPAAVRATRFDAVIEMGPPNAEARERVLRRHLSRFPDLDFARLGSATDGATGADLRDLARRAYLSSGGVVTTAVVLAEVAGGKWSQALTTGAYL